MDKGFENAIEKETAGRKEAVSVLYKEKLESGDTIYNMGLFNAFEQQPIHSCVPLLAPCCCC